VSGWRTEGGEILPDRTADVSRGRGVGRSLAPGMNARPARQDTTLRLRYPSPRWSLLIRQRRDPSGRWCGRGGRAVPLSSDEARPGP
jgi:hypothetical protein